MLRKFSAFHGNFRVYLVSFHIKSGNIKIELSKSKGKIELVAQHYSTLQVTLNNASNTMS